MAKALDANTPDLTEINKKLDALLDADTPDIAAKEPVEEAEKAEPEAEEDAAKEADATEEKAPEQEAEDEAETLVPEAPILLRP